MGCTQTTARTVRSVEADGGCFVEPKKGGGSFLSHPILQSTLSTGSREREGGGESWHDMSKIGF